MTFRSVIVPVSPVERFASTGLVDESISETPVPEISKRVALAPCTFHSAA